MMDPVGVSFPVVSDGIHFNNMPKVGDIMLILYEPVGIVDVEWGGPVTSTANHVFRSEYGMTPSTIFKGYQGDGWTHVGKRVLLDEMYIKWNRSSKTYEHILTKHSSHLKQNKTPAAVLSDIMQLLPQHPSDVGHVAWLLSQMRDVISLCESIYISGCVSTVEPTNSGCQYYVYPLDGCIRPIRVPTMVEVVSITPSIAQDTLSGLTVYLCIMPNIYRASGICHAHMAYPGMRMRLIASDANVYGTIRRLTKGTHAPGHWVGILPICQMITKTTGTMCTGRGWEYIWIPANGPTTTETKTPGGKRAATQLEHLYPHKRTQQ